MKASDLSILRKPLMALKMFYKNFEGFLHEHITIARKNEVCARRRDGGRESEEEMERMKRYIM